MMSGPPSNDDGGVYSHLVAMGILDKPAHKYATRLIEEGYDTVKSVDALSMEELRDEIEVKKGHLKAIERYRSEVGTAGASPPSSPATSAAGGGAGGAVKQKAAAPTGAHQGGRVAAGLGALSGAPVGSLKALFAPLASKPAAPKFMVAMKSIADADIIPDFMDMAEVTFETANDQKQFGKLKDDPLDVDGIAFMMKYSAEDSIPPMYADMNEKAYDSDRGKIAPYGPCMVGIVKHMKKIEPYGNHTVFRGVKVDLRDHYPEGRKVTWHGFCSTTKSLKVLENPMFCGVTGKRTIFTIALTQGQARDISRYSLVASEDEVLLPPGCRFIVESSLPQGDLTLVQLREIESKEWIEDIRVTTASDEVIVTVHAGGGAPVADAHPHAESQPMSQPLSTLPKAQPVLATAYSGSFSFPSFGADSIGISVTLNPNRTSGTWSALGQTEEIEVVQRPEGKVLLRERGGETQLDGAFGEGGVLTGEVIQSGNRGGSFELRPSDQ